MLVVQGGQSSLQQGQPLGDAERLHVQGVSFLDSDLHYGRLCIRNAKKFL